MKKKQADQDEQPQQEFPAWMPIVLYGTIMAAALLLGVYVLN